jgi:hypothetical protein
VEAPQRQRINQITRNRIVELAFKDYTAPQIRDMICKEVDIIGKNTLPGFSLEIPELRTVQRIVKTVRDEDDYSDQETWSMKDNSDSLNVAHLLDTLAEVVTGTNGKIIRFTNEQAIWINKIRESTTGLSGWGTWILYKLSVESNPETEKGLDLILGFKPWESNDRFDKFSSLIEENRIPKPAAWSFISTRMSLMKNGVFGKDYIDER